MSIGEHMRNEAGTVGESEFPPGDSVPQGRARMTERADNRATAGQPRSRVDDCPAAPARRDVGATDGPGLTRPGTCEPTNESDPPREGGGVPADEPDALVSGIGALFQRIFRPPGGFPLKLLPAHQDLTMAQFRALIVLEREAPLAVGELGDRLGVGLPAASRLVERLVNDGLVERWDDPSDRRRALVHPAPRGLEAMAQMNQGREMMVQRMHSIVARLDRDELVHLHAGLTALAAAAAAARLEETVRPANPGPATPEAE